MNKLVRSLLELLLAMIVLTPTIAVITVVVKFWWTMVDLLWKLW